MATSWAPPDQLAMWTVTDHPADFPNDFVARKQLIGPHGRTTWTTEVVTAKTLTEVRAEMLARGLTVIPRYANDEPQIVEVWL